MNSVQDTIRHLAPAASQPLGAILRDAGRLSPEATERALKLQKDSGLRFGDAAIQLGLINETDLQQALARQYHYAYLPPSDASLSPSLFAAYQPFGSQAEQLRALRSQLMGRWFNQGHKALAILSPGPGEGRSLLAANLAIVFAQLGERTLLIDADLRQPSQHQLFKLPAAPGLSSLLVERATPAEAITPVAGIPGLSVLSAGPTPPNPQELLGRAGFQNLMAQLANQYDLILLDTSAASTSSDAQAVAGIAQGALLLACRDLTQVQALRRLNQSLSQQGVICLGTFLNGES